MHIDFPREEIENGNNNNMYLCYGVCWTCACDEKYHEA